MKIIALGDSFTEGFLVDKSYAGYLADAGHEVINLGINGNRTDQMLRRFNPEEADLLIVFGGSNDTFDATSPEETFENIKEIIKKSKAKSNMVIIPPLMELEEAYPRYEINNNAINALGDYIKELDVSIIDAREINPSYIDGLHMREDFHKKLSDKILEEIKSNL